MYNVLKFVIDPIYCLFFRPLKTRNIKNFYYCVFKFRSFKLFLANDFSTKNSEGVQAQYYWRKRAEFPHPIGIVIGSNVKMGMDCQIYQNVTLGGGDGGYPELGRNVTVFANAVLVGPIKIGDNAVIGANSVVLTDVEENTTVAGTPARVVSRR